MDDKTLLDLFGSLSGEIGGMREEMKSGLSRIEARLGRQGGIVNGGSRQVARPIEWSEKVDTIIAERDAAIADLRQRLEKLEAKP
jgi:chloramphenicol 3-O-phosphotransferase